MSSHDERIERIERLAADLPVSKRAELFDAIGELLASYEKPWSLDRFSTTDGVRNQGPTDRPSNSTFDDAQRFRQKAQETRQQETGSDPTQSKAETRP